MIRKFRNDDAPVLWTLSTLPNIGYTADPHMPLRLPPAAAAPPQFPDLADVDGVFAQAGGAFLVAEHDGHLVGMGASGPMPPDRPKCCGYAPIQRCAAAASVAC